VAGAAASPASKPNDAAPSRRLRRTLSKASVVVAALTAWPFPVLLAARTNRAGRGKEALQAVPPRRFPARKALPWRNGPSVTSASDWRRASHGSTAGAVTTATRLRGQRNRSPTPEHAREREQGSSGHAIRLDVFARRSGRALGLLLRAKGAFRRQRALTGSDHAKARAACSGHHCRRRDDRA
jgi:hypothetical protein